jgi:hypothetical protein
MGWIKNSGTARVGLFTRILGFLGIKFNDTNQTQIVIASADPTVTAIDAPAGSYIFWPAGPQWFLKRDAGSTTNVRPIDKEKLSNTWGAVGWTNGGVDNISTIANCSLSILTSTKIRLTLTAAHKIYVKGREVNLPAGNYDTVAGSTINGGVAGQHVMYFDDATGTLRTKHTFFVFATDVCVAFAYWSGSAYSNVGWELHTTDSSPAEHFADHFFDGCQYFNGLASTYTTTTDNNTNPGAVPALETMYLTTGTLYDEDIPITIGTSPWNGVSLGSAQTYANGLSVPIYYYNGSAFVRLAPLADKVFFSYGVITAGVTPQWNSTGTLVDAQTGDYIVNWVYGTSLLGADSVFIRPHNAVFASLAAAQAASDSSLVWSGFPTAEAKLLYRFISRVNVTWSTTHKSKLVFVNDYRLTAGTPVAGISTSDHSALSNRALQNQHPSLAVNFDWTTGTVYAVGNLVNYNNMVFSCLTAHTAAAAFLTDYAAARWQQSARTAQNRQDNTSASSAVYAADAFPSVNNLQSATFTLGQGGNSFMFLISVSNGKSLICTADYNSATVNCITDTDAQFLATDAGTGIVVTKPATSAVITVKNRTGGAVNIGFSPVRNGVSAATAWA